MKLRNGLIPATRQGRQGFLLMEVLPALMLLSVVLAAGLRLQVAAFRVASLAARRQSAEQAFQWTLALWAGTSGRAVELDSGSSAGWQTREFPGPEWLPAGAPGPGQFRFRRMLEQTGSGAAFWRVEFQDQRGEWVGWCRILISPGRIQ